MAEEIKAVLEEGREFCRMKRAYDMARFPDAGTPAFLISSEWMAKYKKYCFYDDLRFNMNPRDIDDDHIAKNQPGPITNAELLETDEKFLKGTGDLNDFESDVADTYLRNDKMERSHFEFLNEDIWKFLFERYGADQTVKRFYVSKSSGFYSSCEIDTRFERVPVFITRADDLYAGQYVDRFKLSFIQISDKKSFSDAKKRIADVVTAQLRKTQPNAAAVKSTSFRMWIAKSKNALLESFKNIAESEQRMEVDNGQEPSTAMSTDGKSQTKVSGIWVVNHRVLNRSNCFRTDC